MSTTTASPLVPPAHPASVVDKTLPPTPAAVTVEEPQGAVVVATTGELAAAPALQDTPVDVADLAETIVVKDEHDDLRPSDTKHLLEKGVALNEHRRIVAGLRKDEVWALVRRFDKQIQHVKVAPELKPGKLDLNIADDDQFSPDKLRANIERLYLTVIMGMVAAGKQFTRLTSWHERNRTAAFCAAYYIAWFFNLLLPLLLSVIVLLVTYPPSRTFLFPPQTLTLVDSASGNKPAPASSGEGQSADTLTGAPEALKGEAAEKEASNFVGGLAMVAIGTATGTEEENEKGESLTTNGRPAGPSEKKRDHGDGERGGLLPDPSELGAKAADAVATAEVGKTQLTKEDKTKVPMQNAAWEQAKPLMRALGGMCDTWEKMSNALSPTPPFPKNRARMQLAAPLVPAILGIPFIHTDWVLKGFSFVVGLAIFAQPPAIRALNWINVNYPEWPTKLDLGNTMLKNVPTNAQLTLTLLRVAEAQDEPLPPPPTTAPVKGDAPAPAQGAAPNFDSDDDSSDEEEGEDSDEHHAAPDGVVAEGDAAPPKRHRTRARLARLLRGTAKLGAEAAELGHRAKAAAVRSDDAQAKVGVLPPTKNKHGGALEDGPSVFFARRHGKKGHVVLAQRPHGTTTATALQYVPGKRGDGAPAAELDLSDVVEIRKVGGLGWKGKMIAGWAIGHDVPDGIEITARSGEKELFTAMPRRDELFDRLVAIGAQRWVSC